MANPMLHGPMSAVALHKRKAVAQEEPVEFGAFAFVGQAVQQVKAIDAKVKRWSQRMPWGPLYQRITGAR